MRYLIFLVACVLLVSCGKQTIRTQSAKPTPTATQAAIVVRTVDGDTIVVSIGGQEKYVRLLGIDTPETHKPGVKIECGGEQSSDNMARLAPAGATATLTVDPTQDREDRYGRLLAYVVVKHKRLQLEQLYAGLAEVYVYGGHPFQRVDNYRRAEGVAKRARRGVWRKCSGDFHSEQPGR